MRPALHALSLAATLCAAGAACAADAADATKAATWPAISSPAVPSAKALQAAMLDVTRAADRLVAVGERGTVLLSDDDGRSWRQAPCPVRTTLTAVRFVDGRTGWATGHQGVVLATRDGGLSWQLQLDGLRAAQLTLKAARESGDESRIRRAGRLVEDGPDKPFFTLAFRDALHGVVAGAYGLAFTTQDGGATWQPLDAALAAANPKSRHLYAAVFDGDTLLLAGEQGLLLQSTDGGGQFGAIATPYAGTWFDLLAQGGTWWLAGLRGHALRSDDRGRSWQPVDSGTPVTLSALRTGRDGQPVMLDQTGRLLTTRDAGQHFSAGAPTPPLPAAGMTAARDGGWIVATLRGMRRLAPPA